MAPAERQTREPAEQRVQKPVESASAELPPSLQPDDGPGFQLPELNVRLLLLRLAEQELAEFRAVQELMVLGERELVRPESKFQLFLMTEALAV
jgi:hypothetical protein